MASLRALNSVGHWPCLTSHSVLRPFITSVSRLNSTKAQEPSSAPRSLRISAVEKALQDLFGDQWKENLNSRGRRFVKAQETGREKVRLKYGLPMDTPLARDDEYNARWHKSVEQIKRRFLHERQLPWLEKEALAEPQKAQSQA